MNARPTAGKFLSWAACWLSAACATYESTPPEEGRSLSAAGNSHVGGAGGSHYAGAAIATASGASGLGGAGRTGVAGSVGDAGAKAGSSQAGDSDGGGGGTRAAGGDTGSAGSLTGGGPGLEPFEPWLFDTDAEGWEARDHSPSLSPVFTSAAGLIRFTDVAFAETKEFLDFACAFPSPADLTGRTLSARLRRASGGFVGVQLYAYGGAWASSGFVTLSSSGFTDVTLVIDDIVTAGFTKAEVSRIGLKLSTGSNSSNSFGPTSLEIDEVSLALATAAGVADE